MELLLNLAWLLVAVPAYGLWRVRSGAPARRRFSSFHCLLSLACSLVILFPIISATDDLRAMRAEMEDSPSNKRSIVQKAGDKASGSRSQSQPASVATSIEVVTGEKTWRIAQLSLLSIVTAEPISPSGRAPPTFSLA